MRCWPILFCLLCPSLASAQKEPKEEVPVEAPPLQDEVCKSTDTQICVDKEDLKKFLQLAKERKCLDETLPNFKMQPVTIVTDDDGRVFYTGNDPEHPYKLEMQWCHYKATGEGKVKIVAALKEPPVWGFRFRPKAYLGYLPTKAFEPNAHFEDGLDAGLMLDFLYYRWINLNVAAGFRSTGVGIGVDLTKNFGAYVGYAFAWNLQPVNNALVAVYFAF